MSPHTTAALPSRTLSELASWAIASPSSPKNLVPTSNMSFREHSEFVNEFVKKKVNYMLQLIVIVVIIVHNCAYVTLDYSHMTSC